MRQPTSIDTFVFLPVGRFQPSSSFCRVCERDSWIPSLAGAVNVPDYRSPDQNLETLGHDRRTANLHAVGVMLFEMFPGELRLSEPVLEKLEVIGERRFTSSVPSIPSAVPPFTAADPFPPRQSKTYNLISGSDGLRLWAATVRLFLGRCCWRWAKRCVVAVTRCRTVLRAIR